MKKFIVVVALLLLVSPVFSESVKLCPTESGVLTFYDVPTHQFYLGARYPLLDWRGLIYLDVVMITDFSEFNGGLGLSSNLLEVAKLTGLTIHITDKLNVGTMAGYNTEREIWYWGFYAGIKFDW